MIVGYARTNTIEQEAGFEAQLKQLKAAGCEKVFSEQVSAVAVTRRSIRRRRLDGSCSTFSAASLNLSGS